jgi:hypothetical protein
MGLVDSPVAASMFAASPSPASPADDVDPDGATQADVEAWKQRGRDNAKLYAAAEEEFFRQLEARTADDVAGLIERAEQLAASLNRGSADIVLELAAALSRLQARLAEVEADQKRRRGLRLLRRRDANGYSTAPKPPTPPQQQCGRR